MLLIKRYPNRKLYDTDAKKYITLEEVAELIRAGEEVQVIDHVSEEDLTTLTLAQIILEQEKKRNGLLPLSVLSGLIQAGGDRLNALQRALLSPMNFWYQVDEEIKQRVNLLVQEGSLDDEEGQVLIDKMMQIGTQNRIEHQLGEEEWKLSKNKIDTYLINRHIATQNDFLRLYEQVNTLSAKIDELLGSDIQSKGSNS
ncbi:polyhydroxyalkanoate synthesis regulator DNA-binding domain-containing protein [Chloroflexota bacterium]